MEQLASSNIFTDDDGDADVDDGEESGGGEGDIDYGDSGEDVKDDCDGAEDDTHLFK